jgi:hypothetical protein
VVSHDYALSRSGRYERVWRRGGGGEYMGRGDALILHVIAVDEGEVAVPEVTGYLKESQYMVCGGAAGRLPCRKRSSGWG